MSKQDRGGVRTAQQLEQKYRIGGNFKKAVKLQEEGLNKTDAILKNFIEETIANNEDFQNQIDGKSVTYFMDGEPTLDNAPAVEWIEEHDKEVHLGDLYYDKNTGFAYSWDVEDGMYKWTLIRDRDTIEALALANSASDTADGKRRVFTSQPYPPYDNGDLLFIDNENYICQVSKAKINPETGEEEVYEEGDFIIATKYTDDTVANKVGDELKVLEGTVLTVIESADEFKAEVYNRDTETKASIQAIEETIKNLVVGSDGETLMTQTEQGLRFDIGSLLNTLNKVVEDVKTLDSAGEKTVSDLEDIKTALTGVSKVVSYFNFYEVDGEPNLELGTSANGFKSVHTNKGVDFILADKVMTSIDYNALYVERAVIREELQVGGFSKSERHNGNVGWVWRGEDS